MKAIIPVAGAGAKLRPHTYTQPKALIPIAGKTILSFIQLKTKIIIGSQFFKRGSINGYFECSTQAMSKLLNF